MVGPRCLWKSGGSLGALGLPPPLPPLKNSPERIRNFSQPECERTGRGPGDREEARSGGSSSGPTMTLVGPRTVQQPLPVLHEDRDHAPDRMALEARLLQGPRRHPPRCVRRTLLAAQRARPGAEAPRAEDPPGLPLRILRRRPRPSETETRRLPQLSCHGPPGRDPGRPRTHALSRAVRGVPAWGAPRLPGSSVSRTLPSVAPTPATRPNSCETWPGAPSVTSRRPGYGGEEGRTSQRAPPGTHRRPSHQGPRRTVPRWATPRLGLTWAPSGGGHGVLPG